MSTNPHTHTEAPYRHTDIVHCIDATGSMESSIEQVKSLILSIHTQFIRNDGSARDLGNLRARVVVFRDFYDGTRDPIVQSDFFHLPEQQEAYETYIRNIQCIPTFDEFRKFTTHTHINDRNIHAESGLEALVLAMQSAWTTGGSRRRHVIVMWTDATAHPLEHRNKPVIYPSNMPKDFEELTTMWDSREMSRSAKRLILFAPEATPWSDIATNWEDVILYPSKAGEGMSEISFDEVLNLIWSDI